MPLRHFRRWWDQSRGDEFDGWGTATYYFEVGDDGWPVRQVEVYDHGPILRYGPGHEEDRFGFLGQTSLDGFEDWSPYMVTADEFAEAWQVSPLLLEPDVTLPTVDAELAAAWRRTVYQMARESHTRVNGPLQTPGPGHNYYQLDLCPPEGGAVLLNAAIRLVAGCQATAAAMVFGAVPGEELFLAAGFRVATPAELALPLQSRHLARLSDTERHDVAYHNAQRIGDALFNWFD